MASLTFPALVLAAVFILHTETADAKVSLLFISFFKLRN